MTALIGVNAQGTLFTTSLQKGIPSSPFSSKPAGSQSEVSQPNISSASQIKGARRPSNTQA